MTSISWVQDHLRFVDPRQHVVFRSEIKPGSEALRGIFDLDGAVANDTSTAVGFAPLSETEKIVLASEQYLNSLDFKRRYPAAGEDVKVMAVRQDDRLRLTIAVAVVDRFVESSAHYQELKEAMRADLLATLRPRLERIQDVSAEVNTLDDPDRGLGGMYLTVLGTSAESGDGGEVGRGNAVNGLISLNRPSSNEAAAGKNTTCHVGNIYNHLAFRIAENVVESAAPVQEACVWLCSQIGRPIEKPWSASVGVVLEPNIDPSDVRD